MTLKSDAKFEEKLTPGSKKRHEKFIEFSPNYSKVKNFRLDGLYLFEVYEV